MNQAFSENSVVSGRNLCNKLWNVARLIEDIVEENENFDTYTTLNTGEDWICREIDQCREKVELDMMNYRFAEAVETLYSTIWDKYADWFLESQKIYRNSPLLKKTLEMILIMLHPFAPFVTEAIWQNLSWTEDMIITQKWPAKLEYDPMTASEFERIIDIVSEVRATSQVIEGGKRWKLLYGDDSLVAENTDLIKKLTGVPAVESCEGQPRGLRLATMNSEIYLDVPEKVVTKYRTTLEEKILEVGRELDALNARMMNPAYVDKAPIHLVKQTQDGIKEKQALIERLKRELEVI